MSSDTDELLSKFQSIGEYKFEKLLADLWELHGWETKVTPEGDDGGVDVVAQKSTPVPQKQVIQAKRYSPNNSVGRPELQQYSSLTYEDDIDEVVVITTGQFTKGAEEVARKHNVKLIDGRQLCRQIDTPDKRQLVESYIDGSVKQSDTDFGLQPDASARVGPQLMSSFDEDVPSNEIPETIPGVLKLRNEIVRDIKTAIRPFEKAEDAFHKQNFRTALKNYIKVHNKRTEISLAIKRYDAGLSQIDKDTTQHLTTPVTFITRLNQQTSQFEEHYIETVRIIERAKGLELLSEKIGTTCSNVRGTMDRGDNRKSRGDKEMAREKYIQAKNSLEEIGETVEIYEELRDMYDDKVVDTHQESSDQSYNKLKSILTAKLDTLYD